MGLTVVVVLVVLAVIAAIALLAMQGRRRREEQQRIEAAEHRHEAEIRSASAQRREAEATERAARAEHEQAQAREQAARARQDREVAEARHAAADRIDPDRRKPDHDPDTADPAGRTDELRLGTDGSGPDARPAQGDRGPDPAGQTDELRLDADRPGPDAPVEHSSSARPDPAPDGRHHAAAPAAPGPAGSQPGGPEDETKPDRPSDGAARQSRADRHEAAPAPPAPPETGRGDPAARTDDLQLGEGKHQAASQDVGGGPHEEEPAPRWQTDGGWHGPSASGGFRAVRPATGDTAPAAGAETPPDLQRRAGSRPGPGETPEPTSPTTGLGEPAAPGPAMPSQRTGEHDRDQREPAGDEHSGPVRALADRLLRRRG